MFLRREEHRIGRVIFIAEQDGDVERELKDRLVELFRSNSQLTEAYLVRVPYDNIPDIDVALCLRTALGIDDRTLVKAANTEFGKIFSNTQSLDILFLNPIQAQTISTVARPFYLHNSSRG
jgi:hypothetical protein